MAAVETSSLIRDFEALSQRVKIVGSSELGTRDKTLVAEALIMRLALLYDLTAGSPSSDRITANWRRTILGLKVLDVESYASDWKTLREIVTSVDIRSLYPDVDACKEAFKRLSHKTIHYKWTLSTTLALVEGDDWFERVNQFIVFDAKLNLKSLDMTTQCCEEYLSFESALGNRGAWRTPDGKGVRTLNVARRCASDMVGSFCLRDYPFRPSHGNGATAEVDRSKADWWHKNRHFTVDSDVITYLRYRVPQDDWRSWFYIPRRGLNRCAEVVCVPKSMSANRTISKEPTTLQYLQQDLFQALDDYFTERLSAVINLHDQSRSRRLAVAGSKDGSYATIDLSSASDSVSVDLVDALFEGLPIHYPLIATRSTAVHVKSKDGSIDQVIETKKFAPMGSAVCFPTECIVFAIIAETAVRLVSGRSSRVGDYVVYGDDIVIREEYAAECVEALNFFGFDVNLGKSFYGDRSCTGSHFFREACGVEAFDGVNITPLRLSRRLVAATDNDSVSQAGEGVGLIDLVNRTYLRHYHVLRRLLVSWLTRYRWFRTCQYVSISDYEAFCRDIEMGRPSPVRVTAPFIITDDACDSNYRAYDARWLRSAQQGNAYQEYEARVLAVRAEKPYKPGPTIPPVKGSANGRKRRGDTPPRGLPRDDNDYFSWCVSTVARNNDELDYELDAMGIATLRSQDLKWSKKWVILNRKAHLNRRSINGKSEGRTAQ